MWSPSRTSCRCPALGSPASPAVAAMVAGVPPAPAIAPKNPWQNAVSVGLTLARGNSDTMLFTADYLAQRKTPTGRIQNRLERRLWRSGFQGHRQRLQGASDSGTICSPTGFSAMCARMACGTLLRTWIIASPLGRAWAIICSSATNTTLAVEAGDAFEAQKLDGQGDRPSTPSGSPNGLSTRSTTMSASGKTLKSCHKWTSSTITS